jgi:hypothetical protein
VASPNRICFLQGPRSYQEVSPFERSVQILVVAGGKRGELEPSLEQSEEAKDRACAAVWVVAAPAPSCGHKAFVKPMAIRLD